ncbi:MAG: transcriptional regulator [Candidatus Raymondbacteria bacterium RifOxyA12_full_50_37]|uniref:Transcriptional regulator n=1 Tax=Candidatus Raymondbacteria bacterium RIFOXYD12_FULL_49_13 TaxID=1817890 RepID=A0A1F7FBI4_UNCRA|nr:MAG: transcriptional regulator [Candidatus Raymondbacteria bacterium RifOxyA12_full_50_37]OGJ88824.1 MAG: transcriptional regulator [Candidatus Raymondbacteria bacterium RifOxyB12_full_50_8]OGJ92650.1 MAG: transcriptional regulator [Candidatus Raymondbacteria bacterium RIFOXYA2_FULL_49_16]OGJ97742.1 MAG: transcriptional regulator [Candidatus Raymondbacteria bacterium RifOxyC12_full_50_8]OGJ98004.1 MAG: transcriptional regulator [Candidatus Raymondbacteria bacterium RIFOXYC2_FULL_50_21]OGK03
MKMRTYDYKKLLKEELKNPEFRKEYDALAEEFELAKEVISLRLKAGLTQKELAEKAHTSQPAIARLESGHYTTVSMSFLNRIGKALGAMPEIHFRKLKAA